MAHLYTANVASTSVLPTRKKAPAKPLRQVVVVFVVAADVFIVAAVVFVVAGAVVVTAAVVVAGILFSEWNKRKEVATIISSRGFATS